MEPETTKTKQNKDGEETVPFNPILSTDHNHDAIDSPKLYPGTSLHGFPIFRQIPTHKAEEGTQVYVIIPGAPDTYFLYVMLDRVWRGVNLPL